MKRVLALAFSGAVVAIALSSGVASAAPPGEPRPGILGAKAPPAPPMSSEEQSRRLQAAPPPSAPARPFPPPCAPPAPASYVAPCPPPCPAPCPAPCACFQPRDACGWPIDSCGRRYGSLELTLEGMYSFTPDPQGPFGEQTFGAGNQIAWDSLNYTGKFGGRGTLALHTGPRDRLELRGTYYGKWSDSGSTTGVFGASPGAHGTGDVSRSCIASLSDEAKAWSGELNWWHELDCTDRWRFDAGLGFRYVQFDERAHADLIATGSGPFPVADGFVNGDVRNRFLGAQVMAALHYDASATVEYGLSAKALVGNLTRDIQVSDDSIFAGGTHSASSKDDEIVLGFDAEIGFRWRFTSWLALTGGYDLLFLDNVQRAHRSMDFSHSNSGAVQAVQDPGQLLVHSLFLGFNFSF